jgi:hypothetical protein
VAHHAVDGGGNVLLEIERLFEPRRALFQVGGQEGAQIRLVRAWNKGDHLGHATPPRPIASSSECRSRGLHRDREKISQTELAGLVRGEGWRPVGIGHAVGTGITIDQRTRRLTGRTALSSRLRARRGRELAMDITMVRCYEAARRAPAPEQAILDFVQSTYETAARLMGWDRRALERIPRGRAQR